MKSLSETAVRARAKARGYRVIKSRTKNLHTNDRGQWQLVDAARNTVVLGVDYDATTQQIAEYLADMKPVPAAPMQAVIARVTKSSRSKGRAT